MRKSVLVLNADYHPIAIQDVKKAFCLVYLGKAEIIDQYDLSLRTVNMEYPYPSIILLKKYIKLKYRRVPITRGNLFKRDGHECAYCGSRNSLTIDHIIPQSKGGLHEWKNIITACLPCNLRKGDRTPKEAGMSMRFQPSTPTNFLDLFNTHRDYPESWETYIAPFLK